MPDPKNKQAENNNQSASQSEGSGDSLSELDQLRQELGTFKTKYESTQKELEDFRGRYDEREEQFLRDYGQQGQRLGEQVKQLQNLVGRVLQPAEEAQTGKKKRPVVVQIPDNVTEQEKFIEFQQGLVEQVRELQNELEQLQSVGGQMDGLKADLKKTQEDLNLARFESLLTKQETELRDRYGLNDRDIRKVRDYMQTSGIYSMVAAVNETPGLDREKMYTHYLKKSQNGESDGFSEEEPEEKPKRKSRYNAADVGKEMLKTKPDDTIPKGNARRTDDDYSWKAEMDTAVKDSSFFKWPKPRQEEYEERLHQWFLDQQTEKVY